MRKKKLKIQRLELCGTCLYIELGVIRKWGRSSCKAAGIGSATVADDLPPYRTRTRSYVVFSELKRGILRTTYILSYYALQRKSPKSEGYFL